MPEWEDILLKEIKQFVFGRGDLDCLSRYLVIALGVPSKSLVARLNNSRKVGPVVVGNFDGIPVSIAGRKGGTIQLEEFLRLVPNDKTGYVIGLGATGALQAEVKIGDLIVPTEAIRGEGLTGYYYPPDVNAKPDPDLVQILAESATQTGARVHQGTVFTTGSIMHETTELVNDWHDKGYLGVECEASALFMLCQYCGFRCAMVSYVTDNPYIKQVFSQSLVLTLKVYQAEKKAVKAIYNAISILNSCQ